VYVFDLETCFIRQYMLNDGFQRNIFVFVMVRHLSTSFETTISTILFSNMYAAQRTYTHNAVGMYARNVQSSCGVRLVTSRSRSAATARITHITIIITYIRRRRIASPVLAVERIAAKDDYGDGDKSN